MGFFSRNINHVLRVNKLFGVLVVEWLNTRAEITFFILCSTPQY